MSNKRIRVVDDEKQIVEVLKMYLECDGFRVSTKYQHALNFCRACRQGIAKHREQPKRLIAF